MRRKPPPLINLLGLIVADSDRHRSEVDPVVTILLPQGGEIIRRTPLPVPDLELLTIKLSNLPASLAKPFENYLNFGNADEPWPLGVRFATADEALKHHDDFCAYAAGKQRCAYPDCTDERAWCQVVHIDNDGLIHVPSDKTLLCPPHATELLSLPENMRDKWLAEQLKQQGE